MAPERVPTLVVWDLLRFVDGELEGPMEYIETKQPGDQVIVDWDAKSTPEGYHTVGGGAAFVKNATLLPLLAPRNASISSLGGLRYLWDHTPDPKDSWAALLVILPERYTLASSKPRPIKAKLFKGRLALLWVLEKDQMGTVHVDWRIKENKENPSTAVQQVRRRFATAKVPTRARILLTDEAEAVQAGGLASMNSLIVFANRFKGFLAFAAFIFLGLILLFTYLFSAGSFDQVLAGFSRLSPGQFLSIVYIVLGLFFLVPFLLVILAFIRTNPKPLPPKDQPSGLVYVVVHEAGDKTQGIADAEVRISLPEPRVGRTDAVGSARFGLAAEFAGQSYFVNASKTGYRNEPPIQTKLDRGMTIYVGLQRQEIQTVEPRIRVFNPSTSGAGLSLWESKVRNNFEPVSLESATADRPYGNDEAPVGKVLLGKDAIPFGLVPFPEGGGHRIIEVQPRRARDQVAKAIKPAGVINVTAVFVLLSAGDTRRVRGEQRFERKEVGRLVIHFANVDPQIVPLRLGLEIREWVSGDYTWDVVTQAEDAEEVWQSSDHRCTIDMIKVDITGIPKDVIKLEIIGECPWLPDDYREPMPSVRISGITYQRSDPEKPPTKKPGELPIEVEKPAQQVDISVIHRQMLNLAREYERVRAAGPRSDERTQRMNTVKEKMVVLASESYPLLAEFVNSTFPGDRLVAVAMLQVKPNSQYLDWLASRILAEKPFIGYQAATALLFAVRTLDPSHRQAISSRAGSICCEVVIRHGKVPGSFRRMAVG